MTRTDLRRARIWLTPATVVLAVAVMAVAVVAGALISWRIRGELPAERAVAAPPAVTYTVAGNLRLQPGQYDRQGQECRPTTLSPDAQVIVTDAAGASLTYAPLGTGQVADGVCDLPFTLTVPAGEGSYGVDVPTWGLAKYSEQDLAESLELTFG